MQLPPLICENRKPSSGRLNQAADDARHLHRGVEEADAGAAAADHQVHPSGAEQQARPAVRYGCKSIRASRRPSSCRN